jgi:hypothetical protein
MKKGVERGKEMLLNWGETKEIIKSLEADISDVEELLEACAAPVGSSSASPSAKLGYVGKPTEKRCEYADELAREKAALQARIRAVNRDRQTVGKLLVKRTNAERKLATCRYRHGMKLDAVASAAGVSRTTAIRILGDLAEWLASEDAAGAAEIWR